MENIFNGKILSLYNQIGLYDAEDQNSYPQWETGLEMAVFSNKGVAVSTKGDIYVEVFIYTGQGTIDNMVFYAEGNILIGKNGFIVGNEIAGTSFHIDWEKGVTSVAVYGNKYHNEATAIKFILNKI